MSPLADQKTVVDIVSKYLKGTPEVNSYLIRGALTQQKYQMIDVSKLILMLVLLVFTMFGTAWADVSDPNKVTDQYITVGDMAIGFSEFNLPSTTDLVGKEMTIYFGDGGGNFAVRHKFVSDKVLRWEVVTGPEKGIAGYSEYLATNPKTGYYYVEFITGSNQAKMVALVLDMKRRIATAVFGHFPKEKEDQLSLYQRSAKKMPLTASHVEIMNASIDKPMIKSTPRHDLNNKDLVGQRKLYQYSSKDAYEHIYHDSDNFTWHCVSGNEKGLADTDYARIIKFEDKFYMIVWVEKVMHVVSAITLNFDSMRSSGAMASFAGWDYGEIVNVSSGAIIKNLPGITAKDIELPKK
jgi:hypothetical protein